MMSEPPTENDMTSRHRLLRNLGSGLFQESHLVERDGMRLVYRLYQPLYASELESQWRLWMSAGLGAGGADWVGYVEVGTSEGRPYVMRMWVEGTPFEVFVAKFKFVPRQLESALEIGRSLCRAVAPLHANGLAHGHLSNGNVFFTQAGQPVVVDPWLGHITPKSAHLAQHKPGSRASVAPEQARAGGKVDARTDVWQLGLLLARLYTGKHDLAVTPRILMELYRAKLPMALIRVIWQALAEEPNNRFTDAGVLATALAEVALEDHQKSIYVRPVPPAPGVRDGISAPIRNALLFAVGVLVVTGSVWLFAGRSASNAATFEPVAAAAVPPTVVPPQQLKPEMVDERLLRPRFIFETNLGRIVIEAMGDVAPIASLNFARHVEARTYEEVTFNRVVPNFVVQGGALNLRGEPVKSPFPPVRNEWLATDDALPGTVGMGRLGNNADSIATTFFINVADNRSTFGNRQDGTGEVIFGRVISGMDVVQAIAQIPTRNPGAGDHSPRTPVYIKAAHWAPGYDSQAVLAALERRLPKVVQLPSGLNIEDIVVGRGPIYEPSQRITVHYTVSANETRIYSSREQKAAQTLLPDALPPGLKEGLAGMRTGGRRFITVPPDLGYGDRGASGVPPNATLTYDVQFISQQ